MNPADDSTFGAAVFLAASLGIAYLLWLAGYYAGRFHRAGMARVRAMKQRRAVTR